MITTNKEGYEREPVHIVYTKVGRYVCKKWRDVRLKDQSRKGHNCTFVFPSLQTILKKPTK